MNIKAIREIVAMPIPDSVASHKIIEVLAKDEHVIPILMQILDQERRETKNLVNESNAELSRALVTLEDPHIGQKGKAYIEIGFVIGEIKKHYRKWQERIKCNFKVEGLP